ncbi:flagellar biosynthetic protein FliO [Thorsellia kenyensis]|uniref:Flagellar protein n=1 Tax=Thorsellia kenyensis TaxID=1549888 RepID=A0ABV6CBL3_9GAMM
MSNKTIDIEAVNSTVLTVPESSNKTPSFSDAYYSLFLVLGFIIVLALIVKKMGANNRFKKSKHLTIIDSISVGTKEKVVIIKKNDTLLTLGVTSSQITLLDKSDISSEDKSPLPADNEQVRESQNATIGKLGESFKNTLDQMINKKSK